ncbi:hypothetical protein BGZ95_007558, partial [Linnemannia exigua]
MGSEDGRVLTGQHLDGYPLPLWLKTDAIPEPHPSNCHMDRLVKPVWTDGARAEGNLAMIPCDERTIGYRSHPRLECNYTDGHFEAYPCSAAGRGYARSITDEGRSR